MNKVPAKDKIFCNLMRVAEIEDLTTKLESEKNRLLAEARGLVQIAYQETMKEVHTT